MDRKYHHGALREALVAAGLEILEKDGLDALTLRGIAAHVGVSHTAPRNHFDGARGLRSAIAAEGFRRHAATMRGLLQGPDRPDPAARAARLQAAMTGYMAFALRNPALFRLMFSPGLCDHDDPALRAAAQDSYAVLREIAAGLDWPAREGFGDDPRRAEYMLWSLVHGYATLALAGQVATGPDGWPVLPVEAVMPDFGYGPST